MSKLKEKETFIMQGENVMGSKIDIIEGENELISDGLEQKNVKDLIEMVVKLKHLSYNDARKMKKEELINRLRAEN